MQPSVGDGMDSKLSQHETNQQNQCKSSKKKLYKKKQSKKLNLLNPILKESKDSSDLLVRVISSKMSDESSTDQTHEQASTSRESPPTPKPLDYRSESKRKATAIKDEDKSSEIASDAVEACRPRFLHKTNTIKPGRSSAGFLSLSQNQPHFSGQHQEKSRSDTASSLLGEQSSNDDVQSSEAQSESQQKVGENVLSSLPPNAHKQDGAGPSTSTLSFHNWSQFIATEMDLPSTSEASSSHHQHRPPPHHRFPYQQQPPPYEVPHFYQSTSNHTSTPKTWWQERKESIDAYLHEPSWHDHDIQINNNNDNHWSYGTYFGPNEGMFRPPNLVDQYYGDNHPMRYGHRNYFSPNTASGPSRFYRSSFRHSRHNEYRDSTHSYTKNNNQKLDGPRPPNSSYNRERLPQPLGLKKYTGIGRAKQRTLQPATRLASTITKKLRNRKLKDLKRPQSAGAILMESSTMLSSRFSKLHLKKRSEKRDPPEDPNKKALMAAANKLRKNFLASKKRTNTEDDVSGVAAEDQTSSTTPKDNFSTAQENAEDLSIKKPNRKSSIQCLSRANGHQQPSSSSSSCSTSAMVPGSSDAKSMLAPTTLPTPSTPTQGGGPSALLLEDLSEEEEEGPEVVGSRRRRVSESAGAMSMLSPRVPRSRSTSMGGLDSAHSPLKVHRPAKHRPRSPIQPQLNKILMKQLLNMDKKSLQELVDDPRSRKVRFLVNQMMSEQRSAIAQRLDHLRSQVPSVQQHLLQQQQSQLAQRLSIASNGSNAARDREQEELQILGHLEALNLDTLSSDVLHQVRAILSAEQTALGCNELAQISLSIDDLMSGEIRAAAAAAVVAQKGTLPPATDRGTTSIPTVVGSFTSDQPSLQSPLRPASSPMQPLRLTRIVSPKKHSPVKVLPLPSPPTAAPATAPPADAEVNPVGRQSLPKSDQHRSLHLADFPLELSPKALLGTSTEQGSSQSSTGNVDKGAVLATTQSMGAAGPETVGERSAPLQPMRAAGPEAVGERSAPLQPMRAAGPETVGERSALLQVSLDLCPTGGVSGQPSQPSVIVPCPSSPGDDEVADLVLKKSVREQDKEQDQPYQGTDLRTFQTLERSHFQPIVPSPPETSAAACDRRHSERSSDDELRCDKSSIPDSIFKPENATEAHDVKNETEMSFLDHSIPDAPQDEIPGNKSCSSDLECQIVSPPPRLPPTMITIDDSDTEDARNLSRHLNNAHEDTTLCIDVVNGSHFEEPPSSTPPASVSYLRMNKTPVLRVQHADQLLAPHMRQPFQDLHLKLVPPRPLVEPHPVPMELPLSLALPMTSTPEQTHSSSLSPHESKHSLRSPDSVLSISHQHPHLISHLPSMSSSNVTLSHQIPRTSSPIGRCLQSSSPESPKPCFMPKASPPTTPPPHGVLTAARVKMPPHVLVPSRLSLAQPTKTSPPVTPHPPSISLKSFLTSPTGHPQPEVKSSPLPARPVSPVSIPTSSERPGLLVPSSLHSLAPPHLMPPPLANLETVHHLHHLGGGRLPSPPPGLSLNAAPTLTRMSGVTTNLGLQPLAPRQVPPTAQSAAMEGISHQHPTPRGGGALALQQQSHPLQQRPVITGHVAGSSQPDRTTAGGLKVKEESPSPHTECHLCQHLPHSPQSPQHLPHCCPYTPTPVDPPPSVPPRPPPPMPPSRSPPSQTSPASPTPSSSLLPGLYQRGHGKHHMQASYLKCENVNRPSSEERPRNPAPPLNTPHRIPSPVDLHPIPNPRSVIFSPEPDIPERPPPPHPPLPSHLSPRIKLERQTPTQQYQCCCIRNECNRSVSRHSLDPRSNSSLNLAGDGLPPHAGAEAVPPPSSRSLTEHSPSLVQPSSQGPASEETLAAINRMWYFNMASASTSASGAAGGISSTSISAGGTNNGGLHHHQPHHHHPHNTHHSMNNIDHHHHINRMLKRERLTPCINGGADGVPLVNNWLPPGLASTVNHRTSNNNDDGQDEIANRRRREDGADIRIHAPGSSFVSVAVQTQTSPRAEEDFEMMHERLDGPDSCRVPTKPNSGETNQAPDNNIDGDAEDEEGDDSLVRCAMPMPRRPDRPRFHFHRQLSNGPGDTGTGSHNNNNITSSRSKAGTSSQLSTGVNTSTASTYSTSNSINPVRSFVSSHVSIGNDEHSFALRSPSRDGRVRPCSMDELSRLNTLEGILIKDLGDLDRAAEEMMRRRTSLTRQLTDLHQMRNNWMMQLVSEDRHLVRSAGAAAAHLGRRSVPAMPVLCNLDSTTAGGSRGAVAGSSGGEANHYPPLVEGDGPERLGVPRPHQYHSNANDGSEEAVADSSVSLVSSSQEMRRSTGRLRSNSLSQNSSNDSSGGEGPPVQRQRCTSTSHSPGHGSCKQRGDSPDPPSTPPLQNYRGDRNQSDSDPDDEGEGSDRPAETSVKPVCSSRAALFAASASTSSSLHHHKADDFLSSSTSSVPDIGSNYDVRITRRRSKSISESMEDLTSVNKDRDEGKEPGRAGTVPDTTENDTEDNPCIVGDLSSGSCKVEFNVSHSDGCSVHSVAHGNQEALNLLGQQASGSEQPQKLLSQSPKSRNSSGSDHSYSLRSRGPPAEGSKSKRSRQYSSSGVTPDSKDGLLSPVEVMLSPSSDQHPQQSTAAVLILEKEVMIDDEQTDDEREQDEDDRTSQCLSAASSVESLDCKATAADVSRHKRKRKTRKHCFGSGISANKRKKTASNTAGLIPSSSATGPVTSGVALQGSITAAASTVCSPEQKAEVAPIAGALSPQPSRRKASDISADGLGDSSSPPPSSSTSGRPKRQQQQQPFKKKQKQPAVDTVEDKQIALSSSPQQLASPCVLPPPLNEPVLDMKVVGEHLFTCSSSRVSCYHLPTGRLAASYCIDKNNITAMTVVGVPHFDHSASSSPTIVVGSTVSPLTVDSSPSKCEKNEPRDAAMDSCNKSVDCKEDIVKKETKSGILKQHEEEDNKAERSQNQVDTSNGAAFEVVLGCTDGTVCVFNGKTGGVVGQRCMSAHVRCVAVDWGQVFVATEQGHTFRWSYKGGGAVVSVEGCVGGVGFIVCHREGCRRVLVMGGRQSPIIVRDAFTGLFLRSLQVVQSSVYRALILGGRLYTAGSRCLVTYEFASGEDKQRTQTDSDVCSLAASSRYLLASCYDSCVRVYCRESGELLHTLKVDPCNKLLLCSAVYRHKVLLGNKAGEIIALDLP